MSNIPPQHPGSELVLGNLDPASLREGELHVWRIALDQADPTCLADQLAADEQDRARRYALPSLRRRFVVARFALRSLLADYLGATLPADCFEFGPNGKPSLARGITSDRLEFNLSHSDELALLVVARGTPVGVDVERIRAGLDLAGVARMVFSPAERAALEATADLERLAEFFRYWTRKEAVLKCIGWGLAGRIDPRSIPAPTMTGDGWTSCEWRYEGRVFFVRDLPVADHYAAAVVQADHCERIWLGDWSLV